MPKNLCKEGIAIAKTERGSVARVSHIVQHMLYALNELRLLFIRENVRLGLRLRISYSLP